MSADTGPLRAAVIGAGWIGRKHLDVLTGRDDVTVAAVCDLDEAAATEAAPPGAAAFTDWRELLDSASPDAVWVCTPPRGHRPPAVAALERGIAVYLEKPIARTLDDADEIVATAMASEAVCAAGYQWRALRALEEVRQLLAGRAVSFLVGLSVGGTQARPWFLSQAEGGGVLLERGSHHIDLARAVAGEIEAVHAAASSVRLAPRDGLQADIDDAVTMVLHFASGGLGTVVAAWTRDGAPGSHWAEVAADGVRLRLDLDPHFRLSGVSDGTSISAAADPDPFVRSDDRFIEAVRVGEPSQVFCSPSDALRALAVALAAEEALRCGTTVRVAPSRA
jgi:myo-inositol 2-dehydrogenase / D-chiro-inositol 1-dehydrogenase